MPKNLAQEIIRLIRLRIVEEIERIVWLDDLALIHDGHSVGHRFGETHVVGHADHGDASSSARLSRLGLGLRAAVRAPTL